MRKGLQSMTGRATADGTGRFKEKYADAAEGSFRHALGLWLSTIGLGTYLGEHDAETNGMYEEAIVTAVSSGCNVIDSAINYRFQQSERAIGAALSRLFEDGVCRRDEVVVCTKGGYLSFDGGPPVDARAWIDETLIRPGIINWDDIVSYNVMHPAYIRHQLETSLRNLRLSTVDVYYLHNPEAQLDELKREDFNERIRRCFEALESAVDEGKIGVYGTATWDGYRTDSSVNNFLSLEDMVGVAESVAGEAHHFRAVQLPFNLAMPEAFATNNQQLGSDEAKTSALDAAERLGLTVFVSASLLQGRLTQLPADIRNRIGGLETDAQRALQFVRSTPGVTTALVGMKTVPHVRENMDLLRQPPMSEAEYVALYR